MTSAWGHERPVLRVAVADRVGADTVRALGNDEEVHLVAATAPADVMVAPATEGDLSRLATILPTPAALGEALAVGADNLGLANRVLTTLARAAGGASSAIGTGGMASKLASARSASHRGIPTVIANGQTPGTLTRALQPDFNTGTLVLASDTPISNRKHWIAYGMPAHGSVVLDNG